MRLVEWQQNQKLVRAAKDLFDKNETFRMMLEVALEESPIKGPPVFTTGPHQDSCQLGYIKGYHAVFEMFKAMRTSPKLPQPIESKFETPQL